MKRSRVSDPVLPFLTRLREQLETRVSNNQHNADRSKDLHTVVSCQSRCEAYRMAISMVDEAIADLELRKGSKVRVIKEGPSFGRRGEIYDVHPQFSNEFKVQLEGDKAGEWWREDHLIPLPR